MREDYVKTWVEELESGKHVQGKYQLGDEETGMCCMGVANKVLFDYGTTSTSHFMPRGTNELLGLEEALTIEEQAYLSSLDTATPASMGNMFGSKRKHALGRLNDELNFTFVQIASVIKFLEWDEV